MFKNLFNKLFKKEKKDQEYYIVDWDYSGYKPSYEVKKFVPGKEDEKYINQDLEHCNWCAVITDNRSTKEILLSDEVHGIVYQEGGYYTTTVKGKDIYTSEADAKKVADQLNAKH